MLAPEAIRIAEETARDLHAQGQEQRARAVETVLQLAASALTGRARGRVREYFTLRQAARALGLPRDFLEKQVASRELAAMRLGEEIVITRAALQAYSDRLAEQARQRPLELAREPTPEEQAAEERRRRFIFEGLPADKLSRLEALHEKMEEDEPLSRAERSEMIALEREITTAATRRLKEWIRQQTAAAS